MAITRSDIETMQATGFIEAVVDLAIAGGPGVIAEFRTFLAIVGPCGRTADKRWHSLAMLCMLYAKYAEITPEIEAIRALLDQRLIDETLKLHS